LGRARDHQRRCLRVVLRQALRLDPQGSGHGQVYFGTDDCDKRTNQAKSLGAKVVMPPENIPNVGRFSMMFDPQGAFFALLQPARK
jgi:predicted enzyme related to lactoylglutathione lyase